MVGSEASLSEVPEGWIALPLSEIINKIVDGSHNPPPKQGKIVTKVQNKIQDPAMLSRVIDMIDKETWVSIQRLSVEIQGEVRLKLSER